MTALQTTTAPAKKWRETWGLIHKKVVWLLSYVCWSYDMDTMPLPIHNVDRTYDCRKFGCKSTTYLLMSYNHHRRPLCWLLLTLISFNVKIHIYSTFTSAFTLYIIQVNKKVLSWWIHLQCYLHPNRFHSSCCFNFNRLLLLMATSSCV